MTTAVSENCSNIGRPRVFSESSLDVVRMLYPDVRSHRGQQNHAYMIAAMRLCKDRPELNYITGMSGGVMRKTMMAELGRIHDDRMMLAVAGYICEQRMSTADGVRLAREFRHVRITDAMPPPEAGRVPLGPPRRQAVQKAR
jgi:hypothetical protein